MHRLFIEQKFQFWGTRMNNVHFKKAIYFFPNIGHFDDFNQLNYINRFTISPICNALCNRLLLILALIFNSPPPRSPNNFSYKSISTIFCYCLLLYMYRVFNMNWGTFKSPTLISKMIKTFSHGTEIVEGGKAKQYHQTKMSIIHLGTPCTLYL